MANELLDARVLHLMRPGVLSCSTAASLGDVARVMAEHHVHFVVVTDLDPSGEGARPWGVVTDLTVARAAAEARFAATARDLADRSFPVTTPDEMVQTAARRMLDARTAHLVVVQRGTGSPIGVLSTLDVAGALGG